MKRLYYMFAFVAIFAGASAAAAPESAGSGDRALIEQIISDWRARAQKLRTIRCAAEGTVTTPRGCYNGSEHLADDVEGDVPSADHTSPCRYVWLFDFEKSRFRIEQHDEAFHMVDLTFVPNAKVRAFDGRTKPRIYAPREWNPLGGRAPPAEKPVYYLNIQAPSLSTLDQICLLAHGAVAPQGVGVDPRRMSRQLGSPSDFIVYGRAEKRGRQCVVLRSIGNAPNTFTDYWVDPERQSAVVYWESRARGKKQREFNIDYSQVGALWLPKAFEFTTYTARPDNPPEAFCRMDVTEIIPNLSVTDDAFILTPEKGVVVWDHETHSRYRYGEKPDNTDAEPFWRGFAPLGVIALVSVLLWRRGRVRRARAGNHQGRPS